MKKFGFTLAEVLITLAIIGIVAALTIPSLMANIQGRSNQSKFKKGISTLQQAGRMSLAKNDFSYGDVNASCGHGSYSGDAPEILDANRDTHSICKILETGLKYSNYSYHRWHTYAISKTNIINGDIDWGFYTLSDGTMIGVSVAAYGEGNCTIKNTKFDSEWLNHRPYQSYCLGFIDVNGPNGPNKEVGCSDGIETTTEVENPCIVKDKDITDIFPIAFHDATVEPASNAAMYVLRHAK